MHHLTNVYVSKVIMDVALEYPYEIVDKIVLYKCERFRTVIKNGYFGIFKFYIAFFKGTDYT